MPAVSGGQKGRTFELIEDASYIQYIIYKFPTLI